jgi:hypothetical protein
MQMKRFKYVAIMAVVAAIFFNFYGCANSMDKEASMPAAGKDLPGAVVGEVRSVTATVAEIDYKSRQATLKMPDGTLVPVAVSEAAYNFDQVKVGDLVDISYTQSIAIKLEKDSGGQASVGSSSGMERAPKGQKPQGTIYNTVDLRAKVVSVDYKTRKVELSGPNGNVVPVTVDPSVPNIENIKVGDIVAATYTEAIAISVRPAIPLAK